MEQKNNQPVKIHVNVNKIWEFLFFPVQSLLIWVRFFTWTGNIDYLLERQFIAFCKKKILSRTCLYIKFEEIKIKNRGFHVFSIIKYMYSLKCIFCSVTGLKCYCHKLSFKIEACCNVLNISLPVYLVLLKASRTG